MLSNKQTVHNGGISKNWYNFSIHLKFCDLEDHTAIMDQFVTFRKRVHKIQITSLVYHVPSSFCTPQANASYFNIHIVFEFLGKTPQTGLNRDLSLRMGALQFVLLPISLWASRSIFTFPRLTVWSSPSTHYDKFHSLFEQEIWPKLILYKVPIQCTNIKFTSTAYNTCEMVKIAWSFF